MKITPAPWINEINEYFFSLKLREIERLKSSGADIINLGIGSPDILPPKSVINQMQKASKFINANRYQNYIGIKPLRNAFASWYLENYNVVLNPDEEILPLNGSKEGIMYISMTYLKNGDKILVPDPGYPVYSSVSKMFNAEIIYYELKEKNFWKPNFNFITNLNFGKIKILWLNYPHMPTGAIIDLEKLEEIVNFAKKNEILIVYDNPYSFILNKEPLSIFQIKGAKDICLELNSLSKSHNMSGWRIGVVIGKKEFIKNIIKTKSQIDTGMYFPLQIGAIEALKYSKIWINKLNSIYKERKDIIYNICNKLGLTYNNNSAGIFVWAKLMDNIDDKNWSNNMLYEKHIFITPGSIFGKCGKGYVRFSLCSSIEDLKKVSKRINNNFKINL